MLMKCRRPTMRSKQIHSLSAAFRVHGCAFTRREYDVEKQAVGKLKEEAAMLGKFDQTLMRFEEKITRMLGESHV